MKKSLILGITGQDCFYLAELLLSTRADYWSSMTTHNNKTVYYRR